MTRRSSGAWRRGCLVLATLATAAALPALVAHAQAGKAGGATLLRPGVANVRYDGVADPLLFLVREPAVADDLELTDLQRSSLKSLNAQFDPALLASRIAPAEKARAEIDRIRTATEQALVEQLRPLQRKRLRQIAVRVRGVDSFREPAVAEALGLTDEQRERVETLARETREAAAKLTERLQGGEERSAVEAEHAKLMADHQRGMLETLDAAQKKTLQTLVGAPFDLQQLGQVRFQPPELIESGGWINSKPLQLEQFKGRVVVLHFWTFGCINCQRNFPWLKGWQDDFAGQAVSIVGIHTPEGEHERNVEAVRKHAAKAGFQFPILIDNDKRNWDAWGAGIWPSTYLIDKQGAIRFWWLGELQWQGQQGERIMREGIELLLKESPEP